MSLRYKLFCWVGSLFFFVFVVSFFWEAYITKKNLVEAELNLKKEILYTNEQKRKNVEQFLLFLLASYKAQIDSLLFHVTEFPDLKAQFAPSPENQKNGTWYAAADIMMFNKWIDFIQNTTDEELASLIIPNRNTLQKSSRVTIDNDLTWVFFEGKQEAYLGVRYPFIFPTKNGASQLGTSNLNAPGLFLLFDPMQPIVYHPAEERTAGPVFASPEVIQTLMARLQKAKEYLEKAPQDAEARKAWIAQDIKNFTVAPPAPYVDCMPSQAPILDSRLREYLEVEDLFAIIWRLTGFFSLSIFEGPPYNPLAPKGIAGFEMANATGAGVLSKDVFLSSSYFNEAEYLADHPPFSDCWNIPLTVGLITDPRSGDTFIGNTAKIPWGDRTGYLTIAINSRELVQEVSLALQQDILLLGNDKILASYTGAGSESKIPTLSEEEMHTLLSKESGIATIGGVSYFFLHVSPGKQGILHFFILNPEEKEFAMIRRLDKEAREILGQVTTSMRLVALIGLGLTLLILFRIASKISRPVSLLAEATHAVARGQLEGIQIPETQPHSNDEIAVLCRSFEEMITGLKEKEKVKGVLNKVVSPEIAQEILKGTVELGGEERVVTVLFGDIRSFTKMTQTMSSQEVISLLNTCMTKVSHVIDAHGGVIDKYVGDEVMALFGAPIDRQESALHAVLAAIDIVDVLRKWNQERTRTGLPIVELGFGIHTGSVVAGNMGAENRLNYTVLGKNVNLASRMCGIAKANEILISKNTLDAPGVKEKISVEEMPAVQLKGIEEAVTLYCVRSIK